MSWFNKEPEPPPPQSKIPTWVNIAVPIIFTIIMGLATYVFTSYQTHAEMRIDENKASIEKLDERKVDNKTMQLMIELQKQQLENTKSQQEDMKKDVGEMKNDVSSLKTQLNQMINILRESHEKKGK